MRRVLVLYLASMFLLPACASAQATIGGVIGIPAIFTAGSSMTYTFPFPDGLEFAAGTGIAVGVIGEGAVPTTGTITGYVMLSVLGYEY